MMTQDSYPSRSAARPRVLARQEPAVYGRWTPAAALDDEQTLAYARDGYLVLDDVFSGPEVERLRAEASYLEAGGAGALDRHTVIAEPGSGAVRSVFKVHDQSAVFARLAADARLVEVARFLLDDQVYIHQSRLNFKPGFKGKEFYWHSDFETWHVEDGMPRMRALSMSVLLTENTAHNGPLMLVPGSHKRFVACVGETPQAHFQQSLKKQEYGVPDEASLGALVHDGGIAAPTGEPGSVVIFDCNTMHGSNSNITPLPRTNAFFVFNAVSNALVAPFGRQAPRPEFIAARAPAPVLQPVQGPLAASAAAHRRHA